MTDDALERVVLLYRDSLDGALYGDNDTRTTSQLLGNPAIGQILSLSQRVTRKDQKAMASLDLERQKKLLGGPYLWFNFISRSIAHSVARLLVEYNRNAIPLAETSLAEPEQLRRFEQWLQREDVDDDESEAAQDPVACVTTAFTALHFLDFEPQRDRDVQRQFGPLVLDRMRRDRSLMIRRVFGTFPLHKKPKDERVLNLYTLYKHWFSGGRALLLPMFVLWEGVKSFGRLLVWGGKAVGELRNFDHRVDYSDAAEADFVTAARKIQRMRGPVVHACVKLRWLIDPEYLGEAIPAPRTAATPPAEARLAAEDPEPEVQADLRFLDAEPEMFEEMRQQRRRARADMRRLQQLLDSGLLERIAARVEAPLEAVATPEHLRALAAAYLGDYLGLRQTLSAAEILREVRQTAVMESLPASSPWPHPRLKRLFRRWWKASGGGDQAERRAMWQAVLCDHDGAKAALLAYSARGADASEDGEQVAADLLRHPGRISEQFTTLRTVQTLALLDVLDYREHVYELGRYAETGDDPGDLFEFG